MRTRPNRRQFVCADDLWDWVNERAGELEITRTAVIIAALEDARHGERPLTDPETRYAAT